MVPAVMGKAVTLQRLITTEVKDRRVVVLDAGIALQLGEYD